MGVGVQVHTLTVSELGIPDEPFNLISQFPNPVTVIIPAINPATPQAILTETTFLAPVSNASRNDCKERRVSFPKKLQIIAAIVAKTAA